MVVRCPKYSFFVQSYIYEEANVILLNSFLALNIYQSIHRHSFLQFLKYVF